MKNFITRLYLSLCAIFLPIVFSKAQIIETYSLKKCIDIAFENNLQIKQGQITVDNNVATLQQIKANQFPTLNLGNVQGVNFGRNIDPYTNGFVEQTLMFSSLSLNANLSIFNGFQIRNAIKQNKALLEASKLDVQSIKDNLTLGVMMAYLQVLISEELIEVTQKQLNATEIQLKRSEVLVREGVQAKTILLNLSAQFASEKVNLVNAKNQLEMARLALGQLLNISISKDAKFETQLTLTLSENVPALSEILEKASNMATIKALEFRVDAAIVGVKVAKSALYPTLSFESNLGSSYVNTARRFTYSSEFSEAATGQYIRLNGSELPVLKKDYTQTSKVIPYFDQLNSNRNTYVGLNLRIPILNNRQARSKLTIAELNAQNQQLTAKLARLQLKQNVEQAYENLASAKSRYEVVNEQVEKLQEAFLLSESQFEAGTISSVDYNLAKTNLDRAKVSYIQLIYDYRFRVLVLNFYQNKL